METRIVVSLRDKPLKQNIETIACAIFRETGRDIIQALEGRGRRRGGRLLVQILSARYINFKKMFLFHLRNAGLRTVRVVFGVAVVVIVVVVVVVGISLFVPFYYTSALQIHN